jgi:hypothetical protein
MSTDTQTAGTNTTDTGTPAASADTMLTAQPAATTTAAPAEGQAPASADAQATGTEKPAEAKPEGAPADYADFNVPEGMTLNPEAITELKAFAKEKNLSQEEAQKLADLGAKTVQKVESSYKEQIEAAQAQWVEASRTDKEFGGDKLAENVAVAKKALDTFGSPELSKMLAESRLGNHPEIIRTFYRIGKAISEDRHVAGSTRPNVDANDPAKKMFPSMN